MIFAKAVNVLSVKLLGLAVSITRKKSLKNQLNGIGPTIDPSGTHEIAIGIIDSHALFPI